MRDLTVSEVVRELRIRRSAVIKLINAGVFSGAYDASLPDAQKRCWRIPRVALDAFKAERSPTTASVPQRRKVRRESVGKVKEFF